jgi:hypothetical protein
MIVYLSDETETSGGTGVVPREGPDDEAYQWPLMAMVGTETFLFFLILTILNLIFDELSLDTVVCHS